MNRERLGSRLGFILLSAGCAIGCNLFIVSGAFRGTGYDHGVCAGTCQPEESGQDLS